MSESDDLVIADGVNALLAMDTARAAVAAAVQSATSDRELFIRHVDLAFGAMIKAGDDLAEFREKVLDQNEIIKQKNQID